MSDLCFECQKNNYAIYRSANLPDIVKSAKLKKQEQHLLTVSTERSVYQQMIKDSKEVVKMIGVTQLGPNSPCSKNIEMHYSFDFAQQVHFPNDPYQPGPMYFLTPRKCAIFGVCCEALPQQVNQCCDFLFAPLFRILRPWGKRCIISLRQLCRPKQEQITAMVFCLACHTWSAQQR
jgi:hypothetical protein